VDRVTLSEPWKKIVWISTTVCNYSCSYCSPNLHDGKYRWVDDYSKIVQMINDFRKESPLVLDIMGGEPLLWPKFQEFCKTVLASSQQKTSIQFTSNGSRSLRYWKTFDAPVDTLGLSFHPEFAKEEHYLNFLPHLHKKYNVKIFLMLPPGYLDRISKFYKDIKNSNLEVDVAIKLIKDNRGGGLIPGYTQEYHEFSTNRIWKSKVDIIDTSYPLYNGVRFTPQNLVNTGKDMFEGWKCNLGIDRLSIEPNGDVYGSTCYITAPYGNIYNDQPIQLPNSPTVCTRKFCGCGADVSIGKSSA